MDKRMRIAGYEFKRYTPVKSFEKLAREVQEERHFYENSTIGKAEKAYEYFCMRYRNENIKDPNLFKRYLEITNTDLSFTAKRYLAEKYFGFEYKFNYEKNKWDIRKVGGESE